MQADIITSRVPMCAGGELQIRQKKQNTRLKRRCRWHQIRAAQSGTLRRIRLPSTADETGEMLYGTTNVF